MSTSGLKLRRAEEGDADLLREWRNDPTTVAATATAAAVEAGEHAAWFAALLDDADRRLWIAEGAGPVGQIRFDRIRGYVYEVSVSIAADFRGQGLGCELIASGCRRLFAETNAVEVVARVRPENEPSAAAFRSVGFRPAGHADGMDLFRLARPDDWAPRLRSSPPRD